MAKKYPEFWTRYAPPVVTGDALTDIALHVLSTGKPKLLLMHLVAVDTVQHKYGIDSSEAKAAIEKDDAQVARILEELERLGFRQETAVVVASDHGFRAAPKVVRPCVLHTEAGLVTEGGGKITNWKATVHAHTNTLS